MKEIIIIILIIILVFGGAYLIQNFLNNNTDRLVYKLEDLKKAVHDKKEIEGLRDESNSVYEEWKDISESYGTVILHEEIDSIETAFIRIKGKIEEGIPNESIEDIDTAIFLLNHIKEKEKTSLKNIF